MEVVTERLADNFMETTACFLNEMSDETMKIRAISNAVAFYSKLIIEDNFESFMIGTFDNDVIYDEHNHISGIVCMGEMSDNPFYVYNVDYDLFPCTVNHFMTTIYESNEKCCDLQFKKEIADEIYGA